MGLSLKETEKLLHFVDGKPSPQPVPGYTLQDCVGPAVDMVERTVSWKEKRDLSELVGTPVFLRFYLKNAGIYSLCFREPSA